MQTPKTRQRRKSNVSSRRAARCYLNMHWGTEGGNYGSHLCIKLKENINMSCYLLSQHGHHPIHVALHMGFHRVIPDLVKHGARVNHRDDTGQTALHLASETLNQPAIKLLLRCGANVNLTTTGTDETALHLAVWSSSCKAAVILAAGRQCVELLLLNGANVHLKNWEGHEAIHRASQSGREDIINLLLSYGADANSLTNQGESPLFLFLEKTTNIRKTRLLKKLLSLSYPLKLANYEGHLPKVLQLSSCEHLKDMLIQVSLEVWSLQDICKFNIKKIYSGNVKYQLKGIIPTLLWNSIYVHKESSYASKARNAW